MRKVILIILLLFLSFNILSCDSNKYRNSSYKVHNYELKTIYIYDNEEFIFDIESQFALSGIDFTKYELISSNEEIAIIKGNKIIGKNTGKVTVNVVLYEKATNTKYHTKVADVYVINTNNMIEIRTAKDLQNINNNKSGHFLLKSNIDLSTIDYWVPIGSGPTGNEFTGIFVNPEGYEISNLNIFSFDKEKGNSCHAGLFGLIKDAYIDGIILTNVNIDVSECKHNPLNSTAGGIAYYMLNSIIRNCHVEGTIIAQYFAGGIVGNSDNGYILDCSFKGVVKTINSSDWARDSDVGAGGIVGFFGNDENRISNCHVEATVIGHLCAGGIIGTSMFDQELTNCTFQGEIIAEIKNELIGRIKRKQVQ
ncbi:MAG TPA: hypothetical protein GXZ48_07230 [Acholeplasmataceae bacterium]|nr:hypothetical protein [Acholeplasmataceae bacterium]